MCDLANVETQFREYIEGLTTQPVDLLLWKTENLFINTDRIRPEVNMEHPFWARFPSAFWAMRIIIDSFLDVYATLGHYKEFQIAAMERAQARLNLRLCSLMRGVQIDLITALSAERYESEEANSLNLLLLPPGIPLDSAKLKQNVAFFEANKRLKFAHPNIHALRKQLNMTRDGCLVMGCDERGEIRSLGVGHKELLEWYPHLAFQGHMTWSYCVPPQHNLNKETFELFKDNGCRLRYIRGRLMLPILNLSEAEKAVIQEATRDKCPAAVLDRVLMLAKAQKKGTIIVITDTEVAKAEAERLCAKHQGILLERCHSILDEKWVPVLQQLTSIDGAILLSYSGECYACGIILDGEAVATGDMARGARYNSALNYATIGANKWFPRYPMAVIVASEDGMLNILSNKK